ncbi:MAG: FecR domain-containing protein, partial [Leptospirales bacterium]
MHFNQYYSGFRGNRSSSRRAVGAIPGAIFLALILGACGPAQPAGAIGAVKRVVGQAELEHNGTRTALKSGDVLPESGTVYTGADGIVIAVLKQGRAEVEIQKNSEFHLMKLANDESELHLRKGNLWVRVNKMNAREKFHVHTPTAVAGVRGT